MKTSSKIMTGVNWWGGGRKAKAKMEETDGERLS